MKCNNCGSEVNSYETICPHCGEILKAHQSQSSDNSFISQLRSKQSVTNASTQAKCNERPHTSKHLSTNGSKELEWIKNTFNFNNIGLKIKTLAQWSCWIGIIVNWAICAIMLLVCLFKSELRSFWWIWPLDAVIMPIIIWIGSWYTYVIGNLIENDKQRTDSQAKIAQALNNGINADE